MESRMTRQQIIDEIQDWLNQLGIDGVDDDEVDELVQRLQAAQVLVTSEKLQQLNRSEPWKL